MAVVFGLVLSLGWLVDGRKILLSIQQLNAQHAVLVKLVAINHRHLTKLSSYRQDLKIVDAKLSALRPKLVETATLPLRLETIFLAGRRNGVDITVFKRLADIDAVHYTQTPVKLSLTGHYANFAKFISTLITSESLLVMDSFLIESTGQTALLSGQLLLTIYSAKAVKVDFSQAVKKTPLIPWTAFPSLARYQPQLYDVDAQRTPFQTRISKTIGTVTFGQQHWKLILLPNGVVSRIKLA